jgi:hypothetical protein
VADIAVANPAIRMGEKNRVRGNDTESGHVAIQTVALGRAARNSNSMECGFDSAAEINRDAGRNPGTCVPDL